MGDYLLDFWEGNENETLCLTNKQGRLRTVICVPPSIAQDFQRFHPILGPRWGPRWFDRGLHSYVWDDGDHRETWSGGCRRCWSQQSRLGTIVVIPSAILILENFVFASNVSTTFTNTTHRYSVLQLSSQEQPVPLVRVLDVDVGVTILLHLGPLPSCG